MEQMDVLKSSDRNNAEKEKELLMQLHDKSGCSLYEHLKECIHQLLVYSTSNSLDTFELLSQTIKDKQNPANLKSMQQPENPAYLSTKLVQRKLFIKGEFEEEEPSIEEGMDFPLPNLMDINILWSNAGVGIGSFEQVQFNLAFKILINLKPIKVGKFWGKVFGVLQNYYIVEAEFEEGDDNELNENEESVEENNVEDQGGETDSENDEIKDVLPKSKYKPPPTVPKEVNQTGVNRKAYFVCHKPGLSWIRLPMVSPQQICAARSICSLFTGVPDAPVLSSPAFPGTEAHYLRAQIARISSCTQISPDGYFHFDEDEEEEDDFDDQEEEGSAPRSYARNEDYEPVPLTALVDSKMQHWVHHTPYILPQGRTTWWNPSNAGDEMEEIEEEEEEEEEEGSEGRRNPPEPAQRGPPILSRVSADASVFGEQPWTTRLSSRILPEHASALVSSNIWLGAHAISNGKQFDNIFIGFGLKATGGGFQPYLPPDPWSETKDEFGLQEACDPTPDDEAALRALRQEDNAEGNEEVEDEDEEGGQAGSDGAESN